MDLTKLSEPLDISDIEFRVQSINKGGYATILAYKDARVDMRRLDDVVGSDRWHRDHKVVNGVVYSGIGISTENGVVWKWDAGTRSFTEGEKGEASDSFKRAGFNWGIGRELYDYPLIQVKLNENEWELVNNKPKQTWNLKLSSWRWFKQEIGSTLTMLKAIDDRGVERFSYGNYNSKIVCWAIAREYWDEISDIKSAIQEQDYHRVFEIWNNFSVEEQEGLWVAPSSGGVFTTEERNILQSQSRLLGEQNG